MIFKKCKKTEKFSEIYQKIEIWKLIRPFKIAIGPERNILVKKQYHFHDQRGRFTYSIKDTKNEEVRIIEKIEI